jgi:hypothetical protein
MIFVQPVAVFFTSTYFTDAISISSSILHTFKDLHPSGVKSSNILFALHKKKRGKNCHRQKREKRGSLDIASLMPIETAG